MRAVTHRPPSTDYDREVLDGIVHELQPHSDERLTREDAAEIAFNLGRYLDVLARWAEADEPSHPGTAESPTPVAEETHG